MKKWSDEFINRHDIQSVDKKLFIVLVEFISRVLSKNDDGNGFEWISNEDGKFNEEICLLLETMVYDSEMKDLVSNMVKVMLEYDYEW